jgi:hypothetical protein
LPCASRCGRRDCGDAYGRGVQNVYARFEVVVSRPCAIQSGKDFIDLVIYGVFLRHGGNPQLNAALAIQLYRNLLP